jgi:hypothetical protein
MKQYIPLIITALALGACNDDPKVAAVEARRNTDWMSQNLKDKVEELEETSFAVDSSGKEGKQDSTIIIASFDEKGYQTKFVNKDITGKVKEESTISHYEGGQAKEYATKTDGRLSSKWDITIDSSGKYSGAKIYDSAGKLTSYWKDMSENEYGAVTSGTEYTADDKVKTSFTNNYKGPLYIGSVGKDSSGKESTRTTLTLDDKGNTVSGTSTTVTKDATKTESFTYKYDAFDEKGNWTQRTKFDEKGKAVKIERRKYRYYQS